jgi:hypothetical protein
MSYKLISSKNPHELQSEVNMHIQAGFMPLGGVAMSIVPQLQSITGTQTAYKFETIFTQAVCLATDFAAGMRNMLAMIRPPENTSAPIAPRRIKVKFPSRRKHRKK